MNDIQIIDGVDVSECPYYCDHDICKNTCHYFSTPCEWVDVQNCTYKQLKRKEQECEELKEDEKSLLNVIDDLQKQRMNGKKNIMI